MESSYFLCPMYDYMNMIHCLLYNLRKGLNPIIFSYDVREDNLIIRQAIEINCVGFIPYKTAFTQGTDLVFYSRQQGEGCRHDL